MDLLIDPQDCRIDIPVVPRRCRAIAIFRSLGCSSMLDADKVLIYVVTQLTWKAKEVAVLHLFFLVGRSEVARGGRVYPNATLVFGSGRTGFAARMLVANANCERVNNALAARLAPTLPLAPVLPYAKSALF